MIFMHKQTGKIFEATIFFHYESMDISMNLPVKKTAKFHFYNKKLKEVFLIKPEDIDKEYEFIGVV